MRRVALLPALALLVAPAAGFAQTPPSENQGNTSQQGDGTRAGEPGGNAPTGSSSSSGAGSTTAPTAAESTPAAPSSGSSTESGSTTATGTDTTRPAGPRPLPVPEALETRTTPILELHGYIRTRSELFHNFSLGWEAIPTGVMGMNSPLTSEMLYNAANIPWYRNPDYSAQWCGPSPAAGSAPMPVPGSCSNSLQTSANMRLRLNPEIHPTEFITIHSQVDVLDNVVLGSTPEGYYVGGGGSSGTRSPWAPITAFSNTQIPPIYGYNGFTDSIHVRRAWAEITNPTLGQIRFGRMPSHWGLGMLANAGNGMDSDYQSTVDRIMYAARFRPIGIFAAAMWDFPSVGRTSANVINENGQGQPTDLSMFDDVHQWIVAVGRRMDPDAQRASLSRGEWVINGGVYFVYRSQFLSGESQATSMGQFNPASGSYGSPNYGMNLDLRNASAFIPDIWLQILRRDFRFELEATYIRGSIGNIGVGSIDRDYTISQFGAVAQAEYRLMNQRLAIEFQTGYASGDSDQEGLNFFSGLRPQPSDRSRTISTFRFHPDYRVDLIFWRTIMRQISAAYYLRPSVSYNFIDEPNGDLFQGRVDIVWSRASEFVQTRGNHADLGVEIDATVRYQSGHLRPDGTDQPRATPGFYAMLQYGVFFPLAGLGPTDTERMSNTQNLRSFSFQTAQTVRGFLGVAF